ncbi:ROK family protein [Promicromonospora sp. Marseille-Q5078]
MARGGDRGQPSRRRLHETRVLDHLRRHGGCSRAQVATALDLSRATVSTLTRDLADAGAIRVTVPDRTWSGVGRRPEILTLDPAAGLVVGIDLGHRHVTVAAVDAAHELVGSGTTPCRAEASWDERRATAVAMTRRLVRARNRPTVVGIGVGVAGSIGHRDEVVEATTERLAAEFGVPVRVDNNARLAGLAELVWGAARGLRDVAYLRLSSGVGGALVLDGELRRGPRSLAAEFGHVSVTDDVQGCRCGKRGCLETVVGRDALLAAAGQTDLGSLRAALDRDDDRARRAVRDAGAAVGLVLAGTCTALDVPDIVLAGELTVLGEHLFGPVRSALARHALAGDPPRLHRAGLDQRSGALGGIGVVLRDPRIRLAEVGA